MLAPSCAWTFAFVGAVPSFPRWVGSVSRECLDQLLILGRRQLEHVLRVYVRPCAPPLQRRAAGRTAPSTCDLLGGLIYEYELAPAA